MPSFIVNVGKSFLFLIATIFSNHFTKSVAWSWSSVPSTDKAPRVSGQATASMNNNGVLLFGGLTGAAGTPVTNDLWYFESTIDQWTKLLPDKPPRVRMYAASAMIGTKIFIFGGWDPMEPGSGGEFLDDIWSFDWSTKIWHEEKAKLLFPVSRHAAVSVDDMAIIHTYKGLLTFRDGKLTEQATKGIGPDSLSMCAMAALGNKVLVFGGSDKKQNMSSEVYVLDTTNWTWSKLVNKCNENGPAAMASASMAPLTQDKCIAFGGAGLAPAGYEGGYGLLPMDDTWICTISGQDVEWEQIKCDKRPEGRVAASLNQLEDGRFLLQGGYDPIMRTTFEQPWILSTD